MTSFIVLIAESKFSLPIGRFKKLNVKKSLAISHSRDEVRSFVPCFRSGSSSK